MRGLCVVYAQYYAANYAKMPNYALDPRLVHF